MTPDFKDKRVLITGAAGGIGQVVADQFIERGAVVVLTDQNVEKLDAVGNALGKAATCIPGDLGDTGFCDSLALKAKKSLGGLDVVVNNAGIIRRGNILEATDEDWTLSMSVNVEAVFRVCRSAIGIMSTQHSGGAIVNVASCWGLHPGPDHVVYCTSKAAVAAMTRCLGRDHAHANIRVNAVAPNEVDTPMLRSGFKARGLDPATALADLDKTVPLGHIAQPPEIADVILYLASEQSRYICGACVEVNGGKPVG